jgi:hypothetical protein
MSTVNTIRLPLTFSENSGGYSDFANFAGGTNLFKEIVHYFDHPDSPEGILHGSLLVPENLDNTAAIKIRWFVAFLSARGGTAQLNWEFKYVSSGDADGADPAAAVETVTQIQTVFSLAAKTQALGELSLTPANVVPGKMLRYSLARRSATNDNVSEIAQLRGPWLRGTFT